MHTNDIEYLVSNILDKIDNNKNGFIDYTGKINLNRICDGSYRHKACCY